MHTTNADCCIQTRLASFVSQDLDSLLATLRVFLKERYRPALVQACSKEEIRLVLKRFEVILQDCSLDENNPLSLEQVFRESMDQSFDLFFHDVTITHLDRSLALYRTIKALQELLLQTLCPHASCSCAPQDHPQESFNTQCKTRIAEFFETYTYGSHLKEYTNASYYDSEKAFFSEQEGTALLNQFKEHLLQIDYPNKEQIKQCVEDAFSQFLTQYSSPATNHILMILRILSPVSQQLVQTLSH